ncbi:MAG: PKD domain-containing protein [Colwellia sp.]
MSTPGVVGVGVSLDEDGQPIIKVLTMHVGVDSIPEMLDGIKVKKQVSGMIVAYEDPTAWFQRPVPIGVSTGHPDITAGTIGVKVTDGINFYALSNNHVYANFNKASIGDNVLQPGSYDGGTSNDVIGTLHEYVEIDLDAPNVADAAIALVNNSDLNCNTPSDGYGQPSTTIKTLVEVYAGLPVQKYGRTTGHTHGAVELLDATVDVCYETQGPFRCKTSANFIHQFGITDGNFSDGGDSGSLIVTGDINKQPVALLFAGNSDYTFASPIELVLESFTPEIPDDFTIDDCSTQQPPSNYPPNANFTYTVNDLVVTLVDNSTDTDGSISTWQWNSTGIFQASTTTASTVTFTYESYGEYDVNLTVTDDEGEPDTITKSITLTDPAVIELSTRGYKVRGQQKAELTWSDTDTFHVYRGGSIIGEPTSGGSYIDNIDVKGGGTYVYKICRITTEIEICSANSTVTF